MVLLDWLHTVDAESSKTQINFLLETNYPQIKDLDFDFFNEFD
jgi:hypothetical protein